MVRQWQELFYDKRYSSSCMTAEGGITDAKTAATVEERVYIPDFVKLAEAHGAVGIRVTEKDKVTGAIEEALKLVKKQTVVLDVYINPEEKVFPMVPAGKGLDEIIVDMA